VVHSAVPGAEEMILELAAEKGLLDRTAIADALAYLADVRDREAEGRK